MAKRSRQEEKFNYRESVRRLKENGPERLYLIWGPEDYLAKLHKEQTARKFTVTGILLDAGNPGMDFSLTPFCQKIYRTSELAGDEIVRGLVTQRM